MVGSRHGRRRGGQQEEDSQEEDVVVEEEVLDPEDTDVPNLQEAARSNPCGWFGKDCIKNYLFHRSGVMGYKLLFYLTFFIWIANTSRRYCTCIRGNNKICSMREWCYRQLSIFLFAQGRNVVGKGKDTSSWT